MKLADIATSYRDHNVADVLALTVDAAASFFADQPAMLQQLQRRVSSGATVIWVEHDLQLVARCDWLIDLGPGAGDEGGNVVAAGPPATVALAPGSRTAEFLLANRRAETRRMSAPPRND